MRNLPAYVATRNPTVYSRKTLSRFSISQPKGAEAISTTQVYRVLTDVAGLLGREDIGTHTMRKTFSYHHYKKIRDIAVLQHIFHHAAPTVTKRYIGLQQEDLHISYQDFRLG